jgi:hypothetical protein
MKREAACSLRTLPHPPSSRKVPLKWLIEMKDDRDIYGLFGLRNHLILDEMIHHELIP